MDCYIPKYSIRKYLRVAAAPPSGVIWGRRFKLKLSRELRIRNQKLLEACFNLVCVICGLPFLVGKFQSLEFTSQSKARCK
jgi:hypothetical protein